jgi:hypothetical protein
MDQKLPRPPVCSRGSDKALFELRPPRPSALHRPAPPPDLKKKVAQVRTAIGPFNPTLVLLIVQDVYSYDG